MGSRPSAERENEYTPIENRYRPDAMRRRRYTLTVGLIVGDRGVFPEHLFLVGRKKLTDLIESQGYRVIATPVEATNHGAIESLKEAQMCAELFAEHRDEIDGIIVTLPNFGDERAISNAIRWSGLDVPVLVHAFEDEVNEMSIVNRRDSFCGKDRKSTRPN